MTVPKSLKEHGLLSTAEVAKKLGVHRSTVWLWIKNGALKSTPVGDEDRQFHGVAPAELERFSQVYDTSSPTPKRKKKK